MLYYRHNIIYIGQYTYVFIDTSYPQLVQPLSFLDYSPSISHKTFSNGIQSLNIFVKQSILCAWLGSEYAYDNTLLHIKKVWNLCVFHPLLV